MPRKRGSNAEKTKMQLLEAATKEFVDKGYDHASLRAICSRAGVTTGALYFFYKSKEDLFASVIEPFTAPVLEVVSKDYEFEEAVDEEFDNLSVGMKSARVVLDICYQHPELVRIVSSNTTNPVVDEFCGQLKKTIASRLIEVLPDCGTTKTGTPQAELTAQWFAGLYIEGLFKIVGLGLDMDDAEKQLDTMVSIMHEGMDNHCKNSKR